MELALCVFCAARQRSPPAPTHARVVSLVRGRQRARHCLPDCARAPVLGKTKGCVGPLYWREQNAGEHG
jgi:hypothetical protein